MPFSLNAQLNAGDTLDFAVGIDGSTNGNANDSAGLKATIIRLPDNIVYAQLSYDPANPNICMVNPNSGVVLGPCGFNGPFVTKLVSASRKPARQARQRH